MPGALKQHFNTGSFKYLLTQPRVWPANYRRFLLQVDIVEKPPSPEQFMAFTELVGWSKPSLELATKGIANSLYWVSAYNDKQLVGFGRVVGDGALYFYVQDVIVNPHCQGQGIGRLLMGRIENYLKTTCTPGSTVGLFAAKGKEGFYKKFSYIERNGTELGLGMCKFV